MKLVPILAAIVLGIVLLIQNETSIGGSPPPMANWSMKTWMIPSAPMTMAFSGSVANSNEARGGPRGSPPLQISHQGVVAVNGQRSNGDADFRFALVDPGTGNYLWTNDGSTPMPPAEPTNAVILPVIDGLFNVRLGNTSLPNMTAITSPVFLTNNMVLRIWFDDGVHGIQLLSPDHPLTSAGLAHHAITAETADAATFATTAGDADTVDGAHASALEESQEIVDAITMHSGNPSIHHARYTDTESVDAVLAAGIGEGPVGAVVAWLKSFPNTPVLPNGWVECNGQVLSDPDSPYNGQTIPALNGTNDQNKTYLRGSTTSGATGGTPGLANSGFSTGPAGGFNYEPGPQYSGVATGVTLSPYYEVAWIMKIKALDASIKALAP